MPKNQGFFVKVVKVPRGPDPEGVRKAFVGLTLKATGLNLGREADFLTCKLIPKRKSISVPIIPALKVLEEKDPGAAAWFRKNLPAFWRNFTFGADELEILVTN